MRSSVVKRLKVLSRPVYLIINVYSIYMLVSRSYNINIHLNIIHVRVYNIKCIRVLDACTEYGASTTASKHITVCLINPVKLCRWLSER